jgi:hypothetical protein
MRLTLRSLLAYLDGVLPGEDQESLAGRVAASAVAQALVARIRRVTGLPGIGAPRPLGRGLAEDPNSVAEYLDNSLPGERLEPFERICLESDMHLAEVASCHAILAEIVRDPAAVQDLDDAGRQRLLLGARQRLAEMAGESQREEARANARVVRVAVDEAEAAADMVFTPQERAATPAARAGREQRGSPWLAWAAAALSLLLIVTLGGVLVWSVGGRGPRGGGKKPAVAAAPGKEDVAAVAPAPMESTEPIAEPAVPAKTPTATAEAPVAPPEAREVSEATEVSDATEATGHGQPAAPAAVAAMEPEAEAETVAEPEPSAAPEPSAVVSPPEPPGASAAAPLVPQGNALAIAAPPAQPATAPRGDPTLVVEPPAAPPPAGFVGTSGIVLHGLENGEWAVLPPGAALAPHETLIAVAGSHPEINIGGVTIRLIPGTEATVSIDENGTPWIGVNRGRLVARASRADARLGIAAARLIGAVTAGLTAPIAVSVDISRPDGAASPPRTRAEVITTAGAIGWLQKPQGGSMLEGIAEEGMLAARSALVWDAAAPTRVAIQKRDADPEWVAAAALDAVEKRAAEALAAKLLATQPLSRALREMAVDRRAENRSLAAATLAEIGEYDVAVELLSADAMGRRLEAKQWTMLESLVVPLALSRGPDHAAALEQAFVTHGPHGKGDLLMKLAGRFTDEDLAAGAAEMLVEALDDPDLVVRRYAIQNLTEIVKPSAADRLRYRADGLPDLRREGANWWRAQLERRLIRRPPAG